MVTLHPPIYEPNSPPIIAAIIPAEAGAPEARAIPMERGRATSATEKPALKSCFKVFDSIVVSLKENRRFLVIMMRFKFQIFEKRLRLTINNL
jgi:hypothetical protein